MEAARDEVLKTSPATSLRAPLQVDTLTRFRDVINGKVDHTFLGNIRGPDGEQLDTVSAQRTLRLVREDMDASFLARFGKDFCQYQLTPEQRAFALEFYRADPRFGVALATLGISPEYRDAIVLPWWNERIAIEQNWSLDRDSSKLFVSLLGSHSYINQVARVRPISSPSVSVVGVACTKPDEFYPFGAIVIGVRGGNHFANALHMAPAGALQVTEGLAGGAQSVGDVLLATELPEELAIKMDQVTMFHFLGRFLDPLNKGPAYVFQINLQLTAAELYSNWSLSRNPETREHRDLFFIPAQLGSVDQFLTQRYFGDFRDKLQNCDNHRLALVPCACALALYSGIDELHLTKLSARPIPDSV